MGQAEIAWQGGGELPAESVRVRCNNKSKYVLIDHYTYNRVGNLLDQQMLNKKGKIEGRFENIYDPAGRLQRSVWRGGRNKVVKVHQYEYELYLGEAAICGKSLI